MKDLKRLDICDSITQNQALQIINFKSIAEKDKEEIKLHINKINNQEKEINKISLKLKISKKLTIIGVPTAIVGGVIGGFILSK